MQNLEQYIKSNNNKFYPEELPAELQARFESQLRLNKKHKVLKFSSSIAAIFILGIIMLQMYDYKNTNYDYKIDMYKEAELVLELAKQGSDYLEQETAKDIYNITHEERSLSEELPAELSRDEKAIILKEYYKAKIDGIKKIKTFLAQEIYNQEN